MMNYTIEQFIPAELFYFSFYKSYKIFQNIFFTKTISETIFFNSENISCPHKIHHADNEECKAKFRKTFQQAAFFLIIFFGNM